jgi:hypothetical protein
MEHNDMKKKKDMDMKKDAKPMSEFGAGHSMKRMKDSYAMPKKKKMM